MNKRLGFMLILVLFNLIKIAHQQDNSDTAAATASQDQAQASDSATPAPMDMQISAVDTSPTAPPTTTDPDD